MVVLWAVASSLVVRSCWITLTFLVVVTLVEVVGLAVHLFDVVSFERVVGPANVMRRLVAAFGLTFAMEATLVGSAEVALTMVAARPSLMTMVVSSFAVVECVRRVGSVLAVKDAGLFDAAFSDDGARLSGGDGGCASVVAMRAIPCVSYLACSRGLKFLFTHRSVVPTVEDAGLKDAAFSDDGVALLAIGSIWLHILIEVVFVDVEMVEHIVLVRLVMVTGESSDGFEGGDLVGSFWVLEDELGLVTSLASRPGLPMLSLANALLS